MNELHRAVEEYLAVRRRLGFQLQRAGSLLPKFVDFLEREGAVSITIDAALRFAQSPQHVQPTEWTARLTVVRGFAAYWSAVDPRTEVPPPGLLPYRYRRKPPHLYTDAEIDTLLKTARELRSPEGLRAHTYSTIFGLLVVTGMRVSEAIDLTRDDVDLEKGVLRIRRTKFGKSRLIPVHETTRRALQRYARRRDQILPRIQLAAFFVSERGTAITGWNTRRIFARISQRIGLRRPAKSHGRGPRLHDLRHRFAIRTLISWYRTGVDVDRHIRQLATYLGHVHVSDTYWYLEAVPELLRLATKRVVRAQERLL